MKMTHKKIRIALSCLVVFLLAPTLTLAATVNLAWDPSPSSDVTEYCIYRSTQSGTGYVLVGCTPSTNLTYADQNVQDGTYFWVGTARDAAGNESTYSNEATASIDTTAPLPPTNLRYTIQTASMDYLQNQQLVKWAQKKGIKVTLIAMSQKQLTAIYPNTQTAFQFYRWLERNGYFPQVVVDATLNPDYDG